MLTPRHFVFAVVLLALAGGGAYYYSHLEPVPGQAAVPVPPSPLQTPAPPLQAAVPTPGAAQPQAPLHTQASVQTPASAQTPASVAAAEAVRPLAEQHCAQLGEKAPVDACIERIVQEIGAGKLKPDVPTFDPEACNQIKDPGEQSKCHGRISQNFAVSTGNMKLCDAIPLDEFRVPCRTDIIVNEVKKLHALDSDSEGSIEP